MPLLVERRFVRAGSVSEGMAGDGNMAIDVSGSVSDAASDGRLIND